MAVTFAGFVASDRIHLLLRTVPQPTEGAISPHRRWPTSDVCTVMVGDFLATDSAVVEIRC